MLENAMYKNLSLIYILFTELPLGGPVGSYDDHYIYIFLYYIN